MNKCVSMSVYRERECKGKGLVRMSTQLLKIRECVLPSFAMSFIYLSQFLCRYLLSVSYILFFLLRILPPSTMQIMSWSLRLRLGFC